MFYELLQNFIFGGLTIASVSYIGTFMDPLLAALWWSFPITVFPTLYFMKKNGKDNKFMCKFCLGISASLIVLFLSTLGLSYFLKKTNNMIEPFIYTTILWFITSAIFFFIIRNTNLNKLLY